MRVIVGAPNRCIQDQDVIDRMKTEWHELTRAAIEEWTERNGLLNAANIFTG